MNQVSLDELAGVLNAEELRRAVEALRLPFGRMKSVRLPHETDIEKYLCFVELNSPNQHLRMIETLGGIIVGNSVLVRFPSNRETHQMPTIAAS